MSDSIQDFATCYPFLPLGTSGYETPDALKHIKDVRLTFVVPAYEHMHGRNYLHFDVRLTGITSGSATFVLYIVEPSGFDANMVVVPRVSTYTKTVTLRNVSSAVIHANDYVLVDDTSISFAGSAHVLHPDCYMILQEAPVLSYVNRPVVDKTDTASDCTEQIFSSVSEVVFSNGTNMAVSGRESSVLINCGRGLGTGEVQTIPWSDASEDLIAPKGLRSINGITDSVSIKGIGSVSVTDSGANVDPGPCITIGQIPAPTA